MKKQFILVAALMVSLASCQKENGITPQNDLSKTVTKLKSLPLY